MRHISRLLMVQRVVCVQTPRQEGAAAMAEWAQRLLFPLAQRDEQFAKPLIPVAGSLRVWERKIAGEPCALCCACPSLLSVSRRVLASARALHLTLRPHCDAICAQRTRRSCPPWSVCWSTAAARRPTSFSGLQVRIWPLDQIFCTPVLFRELSLSPDCLHRPTGVTPPVCAVCLRARAPTPVCSHSRSLFPCACSRAGTGKTTVVIEAIQQIVNLDPKARVLGMLAFLTNVGYASLLS